MALWCYECFYQGIKTVIAELKGQAEPCSTFIAGAYLGNNNTNDHNTTTNNNNTNNPNNSRCFRQGNIGHHHANSIIIKRRK